MVTGRSSVRIRANRVFRIEIVGPAEQAEIEALALDLHEVVRRHGAEIEEFRVEG